MVGSGYDEAPREGGNTEELLGKEGRGSGWWRGGGRGRELGGWEQSSGGTIRLVQQCPAAGGVACYVVALTRCSPVG